MELHMNPLDDCNNLEEVHPPLDLLELFVELDEANLSIEEIENFAKTLEELNGNPN
jgi:hypothetical protein